MDGFVEFIFGLAHVVEGLCHRYELVGGRSHFDVPDSVLAQDFLSYGCGDRDGEDQRGCEKNLFHWASPVFLFLNFFGVVIFFV